MLAVTVQLNVGEKHQLVVTLNLAEGARERLDRVRAVTSKMLAHGFHHAGWSVKQTLALRILANKAKDLADMDHDLLGCWAGFRHLESLGNRRRCVLELIHTNF